VFLAFELPTSTLDWCFVSWFSVADGEFLERVPAGALLLGGQVAQPAFCLGKCDERNAGSGGQVHEWNAKTKAFETSL
jgi:hypothetical protein